MSNQTILKLILDVGFEDDSAIDDIKAIKTDFKRCIKESIVDIINDNDSIISFSINDGGIKEGDA